MGEIIPFPEKPRLSQIADAIYQDMLRQVGSRGLIHHSNRRRGAVYRSC
jgi:hypothetical protein